MSALIKDAKGEYRFIDESRYLHLNPDVAAMIASGACASGRAHYLEKGQHEAREGAPLLDEVFDEEFYLEENPDVADAVSAGHFASARMHFIDYGHKEGRSGAPDVENPPEFRFPGPLPPAKLRKRVHGVAQRYSFERVGKAVAGNLADAAAPYMTDLASRPKVLDFGCGSARVLAYFKAQREMDIVGSDIDAEAIEWCAESFPDASFLVNGPLPPIDLPDDTFDLIYSISVMTHLPEEMQTAWLKELARVAKPGGLLLLTTRGVHGVALNWTQRLRFRLKGFLYCGGRLTEGLPEFYKNAFHSEDYVRRHWGQFLEVIDFRPRGINNDQDLAICRKRG